MKNNKHCPICLSELQDDSIVNINTGKTLVKLECFNCECYSIYQNKIVIGGKPYFICQTTEINNAITKHKALYQNLIGKLKDAETKIKSVEKVLTQQAKRENKTEKKDE